MQHPHHPPSNTHTHTHPHSATHTPTPPGTYNGIYQGVVPYNSPTVLNRFHYDGFVTSNPDQLPAMADVSGVGFTNSAHSRVSPHPRSLCHTSGAGHHHQCRAQQTPLSPPMHSLYPARTHRAPYTGGRHDHYWGGAANATFHITACT